MLAPLRDKLFAKKFQHKPILFVEFGTSLNLPTCWGLMYKHIHQNTNRKNINILKLYDQSQSYGSI